MSHFLLASLIRLFPGSEPIIFRRGAKSHSFSSTKYSLLSYGRNLLPRPLSFPSSRSTTSNSPLPSFSSPTNQISSLFPQGNPHSFQSDPLGHPMALEQLTMGPTTHLLPHFVPPLPLRLKQGRRRYIGILWLLSSGRMALLG